MIGNGNGKISCKGGNHLQKVTDEAAEKLEAKSRLLSNVRPLPPLVISVGRKEGCITGLCCEMRVPCDLRVTVLPSVSGEPRFPSHLFLEQRSPPPPPPPPTLLSSSHPVPTPSPLAFTQPGPAFNQQGQQPVFPRERPVRPNLQPPGPVGILHFSQPGSAATRPFIPPRQPFLPGPGQPFLPAHAQPSLQVRARGRRGAA